jgi:hypothetical protein
MLTKYTRFILSLSEELKFRVSREHRLEDGIVEALPVVHLISERFKRKRRRPMSPHIHKFAIKHKEHSKEKWPYVYWRCPEKTTLHLIVLD